MPDFATGLSVYHDVIEFLVVAVTVTIMISGVDDVFIDVVYWTNKLIFRRKASAELPKDFTSYEQRPIAIMIPAWHEDDVIRPMLETNAGLIDYRDYTFFVGVYQNDPATRREVEAAIGKFANVHMTIVPRDGPTCKADCLNEIIEDIFAHEEKTGSRFAGVALHDSEDVIHPQELMLFNALLTRHDLIQLPIYSFRREPHEFVAGTYMDEFAEWHGKDLVVRSHLTGIVPCAGVSACFSRRAFDKLRLKGEPTFNTDSLTEDYDIAFRMARLGLSETFVVQPADFTIDTTIEAGKPLRVDRLLPIATRELFPSQVRASYRQRARWLIGIVFQGWSHFHWEGDLATRYFFFRDRKGVVTAGLSIAAYFLIFNLLVIQIAVGLFPEYAQAGQSTYLGSESYAMLLGVNIILLWNRVLQRLYFTLKIYGPIHALLAGPRMVVSNILNFLAALRAVAIFMRHKVTSKPIAWDKTQHTMPGQAPATLAVPAVP